MIGEFQYSPPQEAIPILYQDDDLLLVNKPSGLLSVPGKAKEHADCLETRLRAIFPDVLLVHRLDMDTSGIMVFAMNRKAQRHLGLQFERRKLEKTYLADVWGTPREACGQIDLPLIVDWPNRPLQKVCFETGKAALTHWRVLSRNSGGTRLLLTPKTGRSHQLRVHMAAIGHPILGDRFYARGQALAAAPRLHLHAKGLSLYHPTGGRWLDFDCPCPF